MVGNGDRWPVFGQAAKDYIQRHIARRLLTISRLHPVVVPRKRARKLPALQDGLPALQDGLPALQDVEAAVDWDNVLMFCTYPDLARWACTCSELLDATRCIHAAKQFPFNQHDFGFGDGGKLTSSCTLIALCVSAEYFRSPEQCLETLWDITCVHQLYFSGNLMMSEFYNTVLAPLMLDSAGLGVHCRPDEVVAFLADHTTSEAFDPLRKMFHEINISLSVEDMALPELLANMQQTAIENPRDSPLVLLAMVDGKTFTLMFWGNYWILLDSHAKSLSGRDQAETSVVAKGRVDMDFALTMGEFLIRGGTDAAYSFDSRGGFWTLANPTFA